MIFFDWKKGLVFIGFIHYLAPRKTVSVRKRKRNFPKRSTKMKRIVIQEKKTLYLVEQALLSTGRSSIQSRALHLKKFQRRNFQKEKSFKRFQAALLFIKARNTPQPPDHAPTADPADATAVSCQREQNRG